jgi:hypothetical protein
VTRSPAIAGLFRAWRSARFVRWYGSFTPVWEQAGIGASVEWEVVDPMDL